MEIKVNRKPPARLFRGLPNNSNAVRSAGCGQHFWRRDCCWVHQKASGIFWKYRSEIVAAAAGKYRSFLIRVPVFSSGVFLSKHPAKKYTASKIPLSSNNQPITRATGKYRYILAKYRYFRFIETPSKGRDFASAPHHQPVGRKKRHVPRFVFCWVVGSTLVGAAVLAYPTVLERSRCSCLPMNDAVFPLYGIAKETVYMQSITWLC